MGNGSRLDLIRADLQTQITDVFPSQGTIVIVHPKNNVQFHPEYAKWLAETLTKILPVGVKGMVVSENVSNFTLATPDGESEEYRRGWNDAFKGLSELFQ